MLKSFSFHISWTLRRNIVLPTRLNGTERCHSCRPHVSAVTVSQRPSVGIRLACFGLQNIRINFWLGCSPISGVQEGPKMYAEIDKPVGLDAGAVLMLRGSSLIHKRIQDFTVEGIHVVGTWPGGLRDGSPPVGSRGKAPVGGHF